MTNDQKLQELCDREAIRDCIYRYCRGIDRADEAALRSAYWPDATDCHGAYKGSATGFIEHALVIFASRPRNIHQVSNILIEFGKPGVAAVETYFSALQRAPDGTGVIRQVLIWGRYCDRFEKRGEEWRVADRTVVYDWVEEQASSDLTMEQRFGPRQPIGTPDRDDPVHRLRASVLNSQV